MKPPQFVHVHLRDGRELVIHTDTPAFVAQVIHNADGTTDITPIHRIDEFDPATAQRLAALMRRMGDWYYFTVIKKQNDN